MAGDEVRGFGELTRPVTVLVEKIAEAVGGVFAPYQIVRLARAESVAAKLRAETELEITDLQRRALNRLLKEEADKQQNIETVARLALPHVASSAAPEHIESDWITNFFEKCRLTSDDDMQQLWARVLAGEANVPGTFSRRTVNFIANLDRADAEQFTALCSLCWTLSASGDLVPLVFDPTAEIYKRRGVGLTSLNHLESIGLVQFERVVGFRQLSLPKRASLEYFGTMVELTLPQENDNEIDIGHVLLTRMGLELARISGATRDDAVFDYVIQKWRRDGLRPHLQPSNI